MRTLVFQSYRTHDVAPFVARSMASVRDWAAASGHDYRFIDDRFFDVLPAWYRERVGDHKLVLANLARLVVARDVLREGYDRAIWMDADVLVFAPAAFRLDVPEGFALVRETWIRSHAGGHEPLRQVNNCVTAFDTGNPFLDYAIWAHESLVRHRQQDVVPHGTSTRLLTAISAATPLPLFTSVAILTPAMSMELAGPGDGPAVQAFARHHGHPVQAVNLSGSLVGDRVDGTYQGTLLAGTHLDAAIDRLLATRGRALHAPGPRPGAQSGAPAAQSRGTR